MLHHLVRDSAVKHPDRPAVVAADGTLDYAGLDRRADAFARRLRDLGVGRGDRVVVWSGKSADVVAAMQGVLRLGAAYVPADDSAPAERVALVARDCAARVVLTAADRVPELSALLPGVRCAGLAEAGAGGGGATDEPGRFEAAVEPDEPGPFEAAVEPDDLAYILYTSGSTGTPKGVCISHRNALAFSGWVVDLLAPGPEDRFANHAPLTFDLSVLDLYAAFTVGAAVHLVPSELAYAPEQLVAFLYERRITVWYSVPSALTLMMRSGGLLERPAPDGLRAVLFAGEPFPIGQVRRLAAWTPARLLNLYGPTETNVCTYHEVTPADLERGRPVPIGRAASGDRVWARAADGSVCGPGEEGELLVAGPTVMLGYWGGAPQRGAYATGDIVRLRADGSFDYVGRRDHMVKVRGHRVELGDVEAALTSHPDVAEAAVVVTGHGVDARLAAFVVPGPGRRPGPLTLRGHCAKRLPRYMLADVLRLLPELPRTRNGKVDRAALAARLEP
ncbi:amino acid adenylation domain-containing protein [Streptomyces venetus]|uniref:amino acid adenylation domain-containing protein n=1 Tax=Streptomyces venetus TaxID=1701086 RepID=UPI003C2E1750